MLWIQPPVLLIMWVQIEPHKILLHLKCCQPVKLKEKLTFFHLHFLTSGQLLSLQNVINSSNNSCEDSIAGSCPEIERCSQHLNKVPESVEDVMVPLITNCLENVPVDRLIAEEVCGQLETLVVNRQTTIPDSLLRHNWGCRRCYNMWKTKQQNWTRLGQSW